MNNRQRIIELDGDDRVILTARGDGSSCSLDVLRNHRYSFVDLSPEQIDHFISELEAMRDTLSERRAYMIEATA